MDEWDWVCEGGGQGKPQERAQKTVAPGWHGRCDGRGGAVSITHALIIHALCESVRYFSGLFETEFENHCI